MPPTKTPSQRGASSRARGIRFERKIATLLREYGFVCRRVLEYDGFSHGVDLVACLPGSQASFPWPVAVQCKATQDPRSLYDGWAEIEANSTAKHLLCVHALFAKGTNQATLSCIWNGHERALHDVLAEIASDLA